MQAAAFSGGKDSTALVLRLAEVGEEFSLLFNRTGNELPELDAHIASIATLTGRTVEEVSGPKTLLELIEQYAALPSHRMRWCTRQLKIEPTIAWLKSHPDTTLLVGLRADEPGREGGLYGLDVRQRFPLREWGWSEADVYGYLARRGVTVPRRTDCAFCYDQRLGDWFRLWREHPDSWLEGEALEAQTGHTFRSPTAGKFPNSMRGMREAFERGQLPRGIVSLPLFNDYDDTTDAKRCRVCSL